MDPDVFEPGPRPEPQAIGRSSCSSASRAGVRQSPTGCPATGAGWPAPSSPPAIAPPTVLLSWRPAASIPPPPGPHPPTGASGSRCACTRSASADGTPRQRSLKPCPRLPFRSAGFPVGGTPVPTENARNSGPCTSSRTGTGSLPPAPHPMPPPCKASCGAGSAGPPPERDRCLPAARRRRPAGGRCRGHGGTRWPSRVAAHGHMLPHVPFPHFRQRGSRGRWRYGAVSARLVPGLDTRDHRRRLAPSLLRRHERVPPDGNPPRRAPGPCLLVPPRCYSAFEARQACHQDDRRTGKYEHAGEQLRHVVLFGREPDHIADARLRPEDL